MNWVTFAVQWLHVLLGIMWFGYSLALAIFFIPALSRMSIPTQREIGAHLAARATPIIDVIAPAILVLGVIRGTLLGPIDSVEEVFTTAYGITWLVALIMIIVVFFWGGSSSSARSSGWPRPPSAPTARRRPSSAPLWRTPSA